MLLSTHFTSEEWDACFYRYSVSPDWVPLKLIMYCTIESLQKNGYNFNGFTKNGIPHKKIEGTDNYEKLFNWLCGFSGPWIDDSLENGRNFLKKHAPMLVVETDKEWED